MPPNQYVPTMGVKSIAISLSWLFAPLVLSTFQGCNGHGAAAREESNKIVSRSIAMNTVDLLINAFDEQRRAERQIDLSKEAVYLLIETRADKEREDLEITGIYSQVKNHIDAWGRPLHLAVFTRNSKVVVAIYSTGKNGLDESRGGDDIVDECIPLSPLEVVQHDSQ